MERNVLSYPNPPRWYKEPKEPPRPPEEGEFSMFGRTYSTKETRLIIQAVDFPALFTDDDLQDPLFLSRNLLVKLQNSLLNASKHILKALAENPKEAINKFQEYEKILVNFHQLIYWLRPLQALLEVKNRLSLQIESKEKLLKDLKHDLEHLRENLKNVLEND